MERDFAKLDGILSGCHQAIIKAKAISSLSPHHKLGVAYLVATQSMRTRAFRNAIREASALVAPTSNDEQSVRLTTPQVTHSASEDAARLFQIHLMVKAIKSCARSLLQMKWILLINDTDLPFWCSDHPFTYYNEFPYDPNDGLGFERPASQTQLPLSRGLSLSIVDPYHLQRLFR